MISFILKMKNCALKQAFFLSLMLNASFCVAADFNDGVVALVSGDSDMALQILLPLAEGSDHALAQYFVGRIYDEGRGVSSSPEVAAIWYRKAGKKGVADAQFRLGVMYEIGTGVPKDIEYAYAWYIVAGHLGSQQALAAAEKLRGNLTSEQRPHAEKLSRAFVQEYGRTPKTTLRGK